MCPHLLSPLGTRIPLVLGHVLQTHDIDIPHENRGRNLLARHAVVQEVVAQRVHAELVTQHFSKIQGRIPLVHERSRITNRTQGRYRLAQQGLQELRHRHTTRHTMRIHDHIGNHAGRSPRHVMRPYKHADRALLAVTRTEFVAQFRYAVLYDPNLHEGQPRIIRHHRHLLHATPSPHLRQQGRIAHIPTLSL